MSTKNLVRTVVILGIVAWPTVEIVRLWSTNQKLQEAQALEQSVTASLSKARAKQAQLAGTEVANPR